MENDSALRGLCRRLRGSTTRTSKKTTRTAIVPQPKEATKSFCEICFGQYQSGTAGAWEEMICIPLDEIGSNCLVDFRACPECATKRSKEELWDFAYEATKYLIRDREADKAFRREIEELMERDENGIGPENEEIRERCREVETELREWLGLIEDRDKEGEKKDSGGKK